MCAAGFQSEEFVDCVRSDGDTTVDVDLGDVPDSALPDARVQLCVADQQFWSVTIIINYTLSLLLIAPHNFSDFSERGTIR